MDLSGDNPFIKEDPDGRMPEEVVDLSMVDDNNPQSGHTQLAVRVKQEDDKDSMSVPQRAAISPEPGQRRIKSEPDASGGLHRRIKAEDDQNDRILQDASPDGLHDGSHRGDPILISDDEDEGDWELRENRNGHIILRRRSNVAVVKDAELDRDADNAATLELLTEELRDYISRRNELQTRLQNNPGTTVQRKKLEHLDIQMRETRAKIRHIKSAIKVEGVKEEYDLGAGSSEKADSSSRADNRIAKTAREWWEKRYANEKQKEAIERKRKVLSGQELPAKRHRGNESADTSLQRLFGNQTADQRNEARMAVQDLPEAGILSASSKGQQLKQTLEDASKRGDNQKGDARQLDLASRSFGLNNCKPDNPNWASAKWILKGVKSQLLNHQILGVHWMLGREFGEDHGGINADEMGLGKTVQTLCCIAHNMPRPSEPKATLIVAPAAAIPQWMAEIPKHLPTGPDFTFTHFRNNMDGTEVNLSRHAIIMASYSELLRSYRLFNEIQEEMDSPSCTPERRDELLGGHLGVLFKMQFRRVVLDESHAIKNHSSRTSIACRKLQAKYRWALSGTPIQNSPEELWPYLSFLNVPWMASLREFQNLLGKDATNAGRLSVIVKEIMICRTTGDTILGRPLWEAKKSHQEFKWIDLTEEEKAIYRGVEDAFRLDVNEKLSKYHRKDKTLKLKEAGLVLIYLLRLRQATAHPFLLEPAFKTNLSGKDIDSIRSKLDGMQQHTPVYEQLKLFHDDAVREEFGASKFGYQFDMKAQFHMALDTKNEDLCQLCLTELDDPQENSCGHVFCSFCIENEDNRARQAGRRKATCPVCDETIQDWEPAQREDPAERQKPEQDIPSQPSDTGRAKYEAMNLDEDQIRALMRLDRTKNLDARHTPPKKNKDGKTLGNDYLNVQPRAKLAWSAFLHALDAKYPQPMVPSAKTTTVKHTVLEWQKDAPDDKIIIFTQFIQEGQVLGRMLQAEGFKFVYFFGEMTAKQKARAIDIFHKKKEVKIMVASLKCGGVALNLTCANRVILTDPWWNASIEQQAFGRVFRIGQEKETYLQTILVRDTIDKRMHNLQRQKSERINQAMQYCKGLTVQEMISLLGNVTDDENGNIVVEADYEA